MAKKKEKESEDSKSTGRKKLVEDRLKILGIGRQHLKIGEEFVPTKFIPTGQIEIDMILGEGSGIPEGTLVEFCGDPQSGKSYLAYKLIAEAQKDGKPCALLNVENSFYPPRAEALGVQVRNEDLFEVYQDIEYAETYCKLLTALVESGEYGVVVIDSITALIPEVDYEKNFTDNPKIGAHAMLINRMAKKLLGLCARTGTIVVMINQFRMGSGSMPNSMVKKSTGGAAVEYFSHMRLWFKKIGGKDGNVIGEGGEIVGGYSNVSVQKTRYGQPGVNAQFPIFFKKAEVNPLGEFLYISAARGKEYIKVYRKEYQYLNTDTGEIVKSKDPVEFVKLLVDQPAPEKRTKGDDSTTAFEYICGRLKYKDAQKQAIMDALNEDNKIDAPNDSSDLQFTDIDENEICDDGDNEE